MAVIPDCLATKASRQCDECLSWGKQSSPMSEGWKWIRCGYQPGYLLNCRVPTLKSTGGSLHDPP